MLNVNGVLLSCVCASIQSTKVCIELLLVSYSYIQISIQSPCQCDYGFCLDRFRYSNAQEARRLKHWQHPICASDVGWNGLEQLRREVDFTEVNGLKLRSHGA